MRASRIALLVSLVIAPGACKDGLGPAISLSQSEVTQMFTELWGSAQTAPLVRMNVRDLGSGIRALRSLRGTSSISASPVPFAATVPCAVGGSESISGSFDTTATTAAADVTLALDACRTANYTVGGSLHMVLNATSTASLVSIQATFKGAFTVSASGGRSGSCAIDLAYAETATVSSDTRTLSGTVCGYSANSFPL